MNNTLMTDFYELTMAQTYYLENKRNNRSDEKTYFDIFFRKNPFNGGYTIMGGLEEIIEYIKNFKFSKDDIDYLKSLNIFDEDFLNYLQDLKFTGDVFAIPDGTPIFPNEPVLTVHANAIEAQLLETALLASFNHSALVTTSAKRITEAATKDNKKIPVMEFGARRAPGVESSIIASRDAIIGGCIGTSNTLTGKNYNVPVLGTMAHCLIEKAYNGDEYEAFLSYAKANPNNAIFLVDTYNVLESGIPNAIKVAKEYLVPNGYKFKGIRIDSGDLSYLSKEARKMLDKEGFKDTTICLSNGLDEYTITSLIEEGANIDSLGVGDNIAAPKERLGGVYKLVAVDDDKIANPRIKLSNDSVKTINPGYKKVYRFYDKNTGYALGDVIVLNDEIINNDKYTLVCPTDTWKKTTITNYEVKELQVPIFIDGKNVYDIPTVKERKEYCTKEFLTLYPEVTRLANPHLYYVDLSDKLLKLKNEMIEIHSKVKTYGTK